MVVDPSSRMLEVHVMVTKQPMFMPNVRRFLVQTIVVEQYQYLHVDPGIEFTQQLSVVLSSWLRMAILEADSKAMVVDKMVCVNRVDHEPLPPCTRTVIEFVCSMCVIINQHHWHHIAISRILIVWFIGTTIDIQFYWPTPPLAFHNQVKWFKTNKSTRTPIQTEVHCKHETGAQGHSWLTHDWISFAFFTFFTPKKKK